MQLGINNMLLVRDMRICIDLVAHIKIVEAILENKGGRIFSIRSVANAAFISNSWTFSGCIITNGNTYSGLNHVLILSTEIGRMTSHHGRIGDRYDFILDGFYSGHQQRFFYHITCNLANLNTIADFKCAHIG